MNGAFIHSYRYGFLSMMKLSVFEEFLPINIKTAGIETRLPVITFEVTFWELSQTKKTGTQPKLESNYLPTLKSLTT